MAVDGVIELRGVERRIEGFWALAGVSFAVAPGEAVALVGPSGAGKSTILRLIAGLDRPTAGEVLLDGRISDEPPHKRGVGFVFQRPALWPHMSVAENVAFGLGRWPKALARERTGEMLDLMHVGDLARRRPHQLSGGEAQRVALARALAPGPRILLLDEPLAGLDPELHAEMLALFREISATARPALLLVTHDHDEGRAVADRVIRLERGRVVHDGSWSEMSAVVAGVADR